MHHCRTLLAVEPLEPRPRYRWARSIVDSCRHPSSHRPVLSSDGERNVSNGCDRNAKVTSRRSQVTGGRPQVGVSASGTPGRPKHPNPPHRTRKLQRPELPEGHIRDAGTPSPRWEFPHPGLKAAQNTQTHPTGRGNSNDPICAKRTIRDAKSQVSGGVSASGTPGSSKRPNAPHKTRKLQRPDLREAHYSGRQVAGLRSQVGGPRWEFPHPGLKAAQNTQTHPTRHGNSNVPICAQRTIGTPAQPHASGWGNYSGRRPMNRSASTTYLTWTPRPITCSLSTADKANSIRGPSTDVTTASTSTAAPTAVGAR